MRTRPDSSLSIFSLAAVLLATALTGGQAHAQSIARAMQSGPAYLCPKASCPQVSKGAPRAGSGIAVFEISGGFARITGYMDAATARAKYGMTSDSRAAGQIALWLPVERLALAPSLTKKIEADKLAEEARLKQEAEVKKAAERQRRQKLAEEKRKAEEAEKAKAAMAQQKKPTQGKAAKAADGNADAKGQTASANKTAATAAPAPGNGSPSASTEPAVAQTAKTEAKAAGIAVAAKPDEAAVAQPASPKPAASQPAVPGKLTAELKDQRLSSLPSKAGPTLSMNDVVAIRRKGLELLEAGECESLKAGGVASTAGFLFVQCGGISMGSGFTQFPRPAQ